MTADAQRVRLKLPVAIWWLLGALGVVFIAALFYGIARFDDDLTERSCAALRDADIPVDVHFDGRHGYLTGNLEYEEDVLEAIAVVDAQRGVADVTSEIVFSLAGGPPVSDPPATSPPTTSPELTFRVQDGVILLNGRVASQDELDAIVAAAEAAFGVGNVINELSLRDGLESPDWIERVPSIMARLTDLPAGAVAFGPEGASVSGTVNAEATKAEIGDAIAAAISPLTLNNRIDVIVPEEPSFAANGAGGEISLRGQMPDQAAIDIIVAAAEDVYRCAGNVINELRVGPGVMEAAWLEIAPGFFVRTVGLDPWEITIVDGAMTVSGRGPGDGSVQAAIDAFAAIGGDLEVDTAGLEVASEAVAQELTDLLEGSATFETRARRSPQRPRSCSIERSPCCWRTRRRC